MSFGLIVLTGVQKKAKSAKQANDPPITIKQHYHKSSQTSQEHVTCILKHVYQAHKHFQNSHKLVDIWNEPSNPKTKVKSESNIRINFITYSKSKSKPNQFHSITMVQIPVKPIS